VGVVVTGITGVIAHINVAVVVDIAAVVVDVAVVGDVIAVMVRRGAVCTRFVPLVAIHGVCQVV
jgi:hypothetical protein